MKTKHLLMAMALPVAFASCSQDELISNSPETNDIPLLAKDFTLTANKSEGLETRGAYVDVTNRGYVFKWTMGAEHLGVCWTGKVGEIAYTDQSSKNLYTNYLFTDKEGANSIDGDGDLVSPDATAGTKYEYAAFKTDASSLFAGEYVVYSPYTSTFKGVGKIKATTANSHNVTSINNTTNKDTQIESVGPAMFLMSPRTSMVGGQNVANFTLGVKSTLLELKLQLASTEADGSVSVDKIILFDETGLASAIEYDADGNKGTVTYGHKTISATYSTSLPLAADINALDNTQSFIIPVLTENLKATTKIYIHNTASANANKWAIVPFTAAYELQAGIKPLTLPSLKNSMFTHTLVTDAAELGNAIQAGTQNIDILTDITLDAASMAGWTWNSSDITISSATGAKLIFDVNAGNISFGNSSDINLSCDVVVKDSDTRTAETFTMNCESLINGTFTNNIAGTTFANNVVINNDGNLVNNGTVTLATGKDLTVWGGITNNADGKIIVPLNAGLSVSGRNAAVLNEGTIQNDGMMSIIKYNTNSVINNGVAVVGVTGEFTGDFDTTSTGSFWKEVLSKTDFETAIAGIYTKVIVKTGASIDYSTITASKTLNAGSKDIEFQAAFTLPSAIPAAEQSNNFTLSTTGKVTVTAAMTLGQPQTTPASNYPIITINAGSVEAKAALNVNATGVLNVAGDIVADGAAVQFLKGCTVNFVDYTNKNGGSLYLATGANVTYTGRINL